MLKFGLGFSAIIFKVGEVVDIRDTCWTRVIDTTQNDQQKRERERERKMKKHLAILPFLSSVHCCHSDMVVFRSWTTKGKKTLAHAAINNERAFCVNVKNSTDPPFFFLYFFFLSFFIFFIFFILALYWYFFNNYFSFFLPMAACWRSRSLQCCQMSTNLSIIRCNFDSFCYF